MKMKNTAAESDGKDAETQNKTHDFVIFVIFDVCSSKAAVSLTTDVLLP
jgi:hypothetical protein